MLDSTTECVLQENSQWNAGLLANKMKQKLKLLLMRWLSIPVTPYIKVEQGLTTLIFTYPENMDADELTRSWEALQDSLMPAIVHMVPENVKLLGIFTQPGK